MEGIYNPIIKKLYQSAGFPGWAGFPGAGGAPGGGAGTGGSTGGSGPTIEEVD
jgi:L1 cell adhesion molecule like protein